MDKVLIADDDLEIQRILQSGLERYKDKFEVILANNGEEAISVLEQGDISVLVTDIRMPKIDGLALLAYISENYPEIPCIVMTGYPTADMQERVSKDILHFLQKPFKIGTLAQAITEALDRDIPAGSLDGISVANILQLIEIEEKTCLIEIVSTVGGKGLFYFKDGELYDAISGNLKGEEAALEIIVMEKPKIRFRNIPNKKIARRIKTGLTGLIMEAARLKDESSVEEEGDLHEMDEMEVIENSLMPEEETGLDGAEATITEITEDVTRDTEQIMEDYLLTKRKEDGVMADINEKLVQFKEVNGFMGVGAFTPGGELLGMVTEGDINMEQVGILANNALLNSQKTSLEMGTGRGQLLHIEAEKAHILVRCLNEGNDPLKSEPGKAHFHTVLVLSTEGQVGMGKMRLNQIVDSIAEDLR
jgi:CheY-like chemotaxis protein